MPIVSCQPFLWPTPWEIGANANYLGGAIQLLNAAASRAAMIFEIDYAGTLDWGEFRLGTVTAAPANGLRVSWQDLDASGNPDNVEDEYRVITSGLTANTWITPPGVMTNDGTDGGTKRTVTVGQKLAYVIRFENFIAGNSLQPQDGNSVTSLPGSNFYNAGSSNSGSTWTKNVANQIFALKYSDGVYRTINNGRIYPVSANNTRTYNSGSTPDERAVRFQVPFDCRVRGIQLFCNISAAADIILYDASSNVLASSSVLNRAITTVGYTQVVFTSSVTLDRNTTYRLSFKPTTTSNVSLQTMSVASSARLGSTSWGSNVYTSTRTDAGAWSDDQTEVINAYLVIDGLMDGDNSGSQFSFG